MPSGRVAWEPMKYLSSQVFTVYNLADGDFMTLGFLSWDVADALQVTGGMVLFQGPADAPFGRRDDAERVFIKEKAAF